MANAIYYGQDAFEGFCYALGNQLGVNIASVGASEQPRTDGSAIWIPRIKGAMDEDHFLATCGVVAHECAHVYYQTPGIHRNYINDGDPAKKRLRAAAFNIVADVADETRMEAKIPHTKELFRKANQGAEQNIYEQQLFTKADPIMSVTTAGILWARYISTHWSDLCGQLAARGLLVDANAIYRLLKQARHRRGAHVKFNWRRSPEQWRRLRGIADKIVAILEKHGDGSGLPEVTFGQMGTDVDKDAQGSAPAPAGAQVAQAADGAAVGNGTPQPSQAQPSSQAPPTAPGGSCAGAMGGYHPLAPDPSYDVGLYQTLKPVLAGPIERLALYEDADGASDGYQSGPLLGTHIERAAIDGSCFARRNSESPKLHTVLLLDQSGSMSGGWQTTKAVAQAFADAIQMLAETCELAVFGIRDYIVTKQFSDAPCSGGTPTGEALIKARKFLAGKEGRRLCVVITDGVPNSVPLCIEQCALLKSDGAKVIAVAYGHSEATIRASMPTAQVIAASGPSELAVQLARVAAEIAAST